MSEKSYLSAGENVDESEWCGSRGASECGRYTSVFPMPSSTASATCWTTVTSATSTKETSDDEAAWLLQFPLLPEAVDEVLDDLEATGLDADRYTVVGNAETARPDQSNSARRHEDRLPR